MCLLRARLAAGTTHSSPRGKDFFFLHSLKEMYKQEVMQVAEDVGRRRRRKRSGGRRRGGAVALIMDSPGASLRGVIPRAAGRCAVRALRPSVGTQQRVAVRGTFTTFTRHTHTHSVTRRGSLTAIVLGPPSAHNAALHFVVPDSAGRQPAGRTGVRALPRSWPPQPPQPLCMRRSALQIPPPLSAFSPFFLVCV